MFPHKSTDWVDNLDEIIKVFEKIANTISKYQKCLVCYSDDENIKNLQNKKNPNIIFKKISSDDTWCRDFGAITVEENNNKKLLDFTFNGWGNKFDSKQDNQINKKIFSDIESIDFVLEGGSIDTNGDGILLTTTDCLLEKNRNPQYNKKQIELKLKEYLGISNILWLENGYLEGDDTNSHIDMLARFVNKNTIVYLSCDNKDDIHYNSLQKMKQELEKTKFNLVPLPWISPKYYNNERLPASYANFLIINNAILVPTYNDKNDKKALKIFKELFLNRDIINIDCSKIIRQNGSLHCLTMQYYDKDLYILKP
jgi:agmatine deiminase